ncbi:MAG: hypothetical protein H6577_11165 [Lewinellaceae bacterium]|nr:hypothetical protein [Saprospiraceae bacterium]MCB9338674.1 hypothetical protein [Lewinellaceae bacterium]
MGNTAQITSDLQYVIANDCTDGGKLPISNRGVLLSVLGNNLTGSPVTPELDKAIAEKIRGKRPFFEFEVKELDKNHICISYQELSNTVFVVGISDIIVSFANPQDVEKDKLKAVGVKLKPKPEEGLSSRHVILIRLEGKIGSNKNLSFYLIDATAG